MADESDCMLSRCESVSVSRCSGNRNSGGSESAMVVKSAPTLSFLLFPPCLSGLFVKTEISLAALEKTDPVMLWSGSWARSVGDRNRNGNGRGGKQTFETGCNGSQARGRAARDPRRRDCASTVASTVKSRSLVPLCSRCQVGSKLSRPVRGF